jgi:hypothetical protein
VFGSRSYFNVEAGDQCLRVKWSQKVKDAQVEGDEILKGLEGKVSRCC